jgi:RNA polymerase sigma factor (sigma-70 family)
MQVEGTKDLVLRARAGDREAWDVLFARLCPALLARARRDLPLCWPSNESVSFSLGAVWQRGWAGVAHFTGGSTDADTAGRLLAWLAQIFKNALRNDFSRVLNRRQANAAPLGPDDSTATGADRCPPANGPGPLQVVIEKEDLSRIREAVAALPAEDREWARALFEGDKSIRQIARERGCDESTVRHHRTRVLRRLQGLE